MNTSILLIAHGVDARHEETILQQQSMRKDTTVSVRALVSAHILMVFPKNLNGIVSYQYTKPFPNFV